MTITNYATKNSDIYYRNIKSKTDIRLSDEKMNLIQKDIQILRNDGKTEKEIDKIIEDKFNILVSVSLVNPPKKNISFEERLRKVISFLLSYATIEKDQYSVIVTLGEKGFYVAKDINNNDEKFLKEQVIFDLCFLDKDSYQPNNDIILKRIIREELRKFLILRNDNN